MTSYVVMEPPDGTSMHGGSARNGSDESRAVLVRDGFHFLAFLVPVLWLLFQRLWLEALFILAATLAISGLGTFAGLGAAAPVLTLLVSLYVGLEAPALKLAAMRRRGWRDRGVVEADNARDAELRYYLAVGGDDTQAPMKEASIPLAAEPALSPQLSQGPALGLFSYPGRN